MWNTCRKPIPAFPSTQMILSEGEAISRVLEFDGRSRPDLVVKRLKREGVPRCGREKTREEIRLLEKLDGASFVPHVELTGSLDERPWYVMERLSPVVAGEEREIQCVLDVITGIASALAYIHKAGVAHRDVKLENIFRRSGGTVVIGDYGLAVDADTPDEIFNYWCPTGRRYDVPDEMIYITAESGMPIEEKIRILQSSDIYMLGYRIHELVTGEMLTAPEEDFPRFCSKVTRFFSYDVTDYALFFFFRAVSESTERDWRKRCPLETVMRYVSNARQAVEGKQLSSQDIAEATIVIERAVLHSRIDNADFAVFTQSEDIDAFLGPVLKYVRLVHNSREIGFSDIEIENGVVAMTVGLWNIQFSIGRLTFYNLRENHPLFRIETKYHERSDCGAGIRSHLQDILSQDGEVLTAYQVHDTATLN